MVANNSLSFLHNTVSQRAFFRGKKYYLPLSNVLRGKILWEKKRTFTSVTLKFSSNVHIQGDDI